MKKTLPIIIVLISLSLLGLIWLQASWISNLLEVRQLEFDTNVKTACRNVSNDVSNHLYDDGENFNFNKNLKKLGYGGNSFSLSLLQPPTVSSKFSENDIKDRLANAFAKQGVPHIKFEFAVVNSAADYEMQSAKFAEAFYDTSHNKIYTTPIFPQTGTDFENLSTAQHIVVIIPKFIQQIWSSLLWILVAAGLCMLIIIAAFYLTVTTLLNQKKLSEIKGDFINNMTHEFKTPIATISLAVDALKNEKVLNSADKLAYFRDIIKEENLRMNKHVESILQAAILDKKEISYSKENIDVHQVIQGVLDKYQLQINDKQAQVQLLLQASHYFIEGDVLHFTNIISNLMDNAIKYSKDEDICIKISTENHKHQLHIIIEDNGIGMSKETVKNIFEKFYRAHTGNVHYVKGFGLGMSYVKTVVDDMGGHIKVASSIGKGSTFTLSFNNIK